MKLNLNHLILADCSHRQFLSKQKFAYKVMDLLEIRKSCNYFSAVDSLRGKNLIKYTEDDWMIIYSD